MSAEPQGHRQRRSVLGLLGDNAAFAAAARLEAIGREGALDQAAEAFADLETRVETFTDILAGFAVGGGG